MVWVRDMVRVKDLVRGINIVLGIEIITILVVVKNDGLTIFLKKFQNLIFYDPQLTPI